MDTHRIGIIMNGVTGRMGTNQHLERSIMAIRKHGGIKVGHGTVIMPDPILVGRNADKLKHLSERHDSIPYSTDLDSLLGDPKYPIYFDAQTTQMRFESVSKALAAGKHVYCEKPVAESSAAGDGTGAAGRAGGASKTAWCRTNSGFREFAN